VKRRSLASSHFPVESSIGEPPNYWNKSTNKDSSMTTLYFLTIATGSC
jgi:hypothetical protein